MPGGQADEAGVKAGKFVVELNYVKVRGGGDMQKGNQERSPISF